MNSPSYESETSQNSVFLKNITIFMKNQYDILRLLYTTPPCLIVYSLFFTFCLFLVDFLEMKIFYSIPLKSSCFFLSIFSKWTVKNKAHGVYKLYARLTNYIPIHYHYNNHPGSSLFLGKKWRHGDIFFVSMLQLLSMCQYQR